MATGSVCDASTCIRPAVYVVCTRVGRRRGVGGVSGWQSLKPMKSMRKRCRHFVLFCFVLFVVNSGRGGP